MSCALRTSIWLDTTTPVVRLTSSIRSVHCPTADAVPALTVFHCTVTVSPPCQRLAGSRLKPLICKLA